MEHLGYQDWLEMGVPDPNASILCFSWSDSVQFKLRHTCKFSIFCILYVALYPKQGKSKSTKQVLKRIDYGGSFTLLMGVSLLHFIIAAVITYLHRSVHF